MSSFFLRGVSIQLREVESLSFVTCVRRARKAGNHTAHAHCPRSRFQTTTTGGKKQTKNQNQTSKILWVDRLLSLSLEMLDDFWETSEANYWWRLPVQTWISDHPTRPRPRRRVSKIKTTCPFSEIHHNMFVRVRSRRNGYSSLFWASKHARKFPAE